MRVFYFLFAFAPFAESTTVKVFHDKEFELPQSCFMVVRGEHENDFTCPSPSDRFRGISFPLPQDVDEYQTDFNEHQENTNGKAPINRAKSFSTEEIDERSHILAVWEFNGVEEYSYTICDYRSCIKFNANDFSFIQPLALSVSSEILGLN